MRKIIYLFIFFFLINHSYSDNKISKNFYGCNFKDQGINSYDIEKLKILDLAVEIKKYRKWSKNNIKILTSGTRFISDKYKQRFKADVIINYEKGLYCKFQAKVRQSGDAKDHIKLENNSIVQSLDIDLDSGNIRGVTKFKLYKSDVRGNLEDEILQTILLRNFGYLAPRSIKVNARVNDSVSIMLFQEKSAKELLEFNNRREGPILEGDQKYFFKLVENIPDNNLSNWSVGTPFLRNKTMQAMLSKSTNARLLDRSNSHKFITFQAINNLNLIYLYWANRFQDEKNNYFFFDYDLDNELLGLFEKKNIIKLDAFNLLMQSTNSHHALGPDARKYYWNSFERFYEPIYYDSNVNIDLTNPTTTTNFGLRLPVSHFFGESIVFLEDKLNTINFDSLKTQLEFHGVDFNKEKILKKIEKIKLNLSNLKKNYYHNIEKTLSLIEYNYYNKNTEIINKINRTLEEIDPNSYLILLNESYSEAKKCKLFFENCKNIDLNNDQLVKLAEGELKLDKTNYQLFTHDQSLEVLKKKENLNYLIFEKSEIAYEDGIQVKYEKDTKTLVVNQESPGSRAYILNGSLENINILFNGYNIYEPNIFDLKTFPQNFPINTKNLTGCLSFINTYVKDININFKNSNCEDSINFINSRGVVNNLIISNSFSDALDSDFSDLLFKNVIINQAGNDCADVSSGTYRFINMNLKNCGDKALSVGEKSLVNVDLIEAESSNTGIASKDSSQVFSKKNIFNKVKTCVNAYKKKQEFEGAFLAMDSFNCSEYFRIYDIDGYSKIQINNKDIKEINLNDYNLKNKLNLDEDKKLINFSSIAKSASSEQISVVILSSKNSKGIFDISIGDKSFKQDFNKGKPAYLYANYKYNIGIIPGTISKYSPPDEDKYLNVIILGEGALEQGEVVEGKILGSMQIYDLGHEDLKIVMALKDTEFYDYNNLEHIINSSPKTLDKLISWLESHKGKKVIKFKNYLSLSETARIIEESKKKYKNLYD